MHKLTEATTLVTTSTSPSPDVEQSARAIADLLGCTFVQRERQTLSRLLERHNAAAALVADGVELRLVYDGRSYAFHPNMAVHRVAALRAGRKDRLVEVAALRAGDTVLDCTLGLGADAAVVSYAVGATGAVHALEASAMLAAIVGYGLEHYQYKGAELTDAMRRVTVTNADFASTLPTLASNSWDVVYFDPMFETTLTDTNSIDLVRLLGSDTLPLRDSIDEARRVARRSVVVKDSLLGRFLKAMDIPIVSNSQRVRYGRLEAS